MERFTRLVGRAAPLPRADIDTDIIFPARFLVHTEKRGLGRFAFYDWAHDAQGGERGDFVLNQPRFGGAEILVAGENFGCGSSREQAPWALHDLGVRAVIAPSFGEIFYANCFKNGMAPVELPAEAVGRLMAAAEAGRPLVVDLERQEAGVDGGERYAFETPAWRREALLNGWDEIAMVLNRDGEAIAAFEARQRARSPWLYAGEGEPACPLSGQAAAPPATGRVG